MRNYFLGLVLLNLTATTYAQDIFYPSYDSLESWRLQSQSPALAVGIIEKGSLRAIYTTGELRKGSQAPENAIFNVASLAKATTTYITLKLVASGEWNFHEPLATYWIDPDVEDHEYTKLLTTHHVLSHSSGFPNWRFMDESGKLTFNFKPGTQFGYSGEGFEYLRRALEKKFNTSFEQLTDSLLFTPLRMSDSFIVWNDVTDSARIAVPHNAQGEAYSITKRTIPNAADDLFTTISNFGTFVSAVMDSTSLSPELFQKLISPQTQVRPGVSFSYGWIVFEGLPDNEYALFNAGSDQGVNALVVLLPESGRGMIAFTNGDSGRPLVMRMIAEILDRTGDAILSRF